MNMLSRNFCSPRTVWIFLILLALLVGLLDSLDQWIVLVRSPQVFGGYVVPPIDTHRHVLFPQMRDIIDGHWLIADTQLYEYRDGPPLTPWPWLPPLLYAGFWKLFGSALWLPMSSLIVGALSFLILQQIITEITGRRALGILFAVLTFASRLWAIMLFPTNVAELKMFIDLFVPGLFSTTLARADFLAWESFNPTFLLWGPCLLLLLRALLHNRPRLLLWVGLLGGALVYCYTFHWVTTGIMLGLVALGALFQKRFFLFRWAVLAIFVYLFMSIPFLWNQIILHQTGIADIMQLRNAGFEYGRYFRISQWKWYVLWIFLLFIAHRLARKKEDQGTVFFLGCFLGAIGVGLNLQLITSVNLQPDHWINKVGFIPLGWLLAYLYGAVLDRLHAIQKYAAVAALSLLVVFVCGATVGAFQAQWVSAHAQLATPVFSSDVWRAYGWIDEHLPVDTVIMTPSVTVGTYLTTYTSARSFLSYSLDTFATEEEMLDRLFTTYTFFGIPATYLARQLQEDDDWRMGVAQYVNSYDFDIRRQVYWLQFGSKDFDVSLTGQIHPEIPELDQKRILDAYKTYRFDGAVIRDRYRWDYVLTTPYDQFVGSPQFADRSDLEEVFRSGRVILYRLTDTPLVSPVTIR